MTPKTVDIGAALALVLVSAAARAHDVIGAAQVVVLQTARLKVARDLELAQTLVSDL